jgi:hypothetical protein
MLALGYIAEHPGSSNREIAVGAGVSDDGQMSRLLHRIEQMEFAVNRGTGGLGGPNAWYITAVGRTSLAGSRNTRVSSHVPR